MICRTLAHRPHQVRNCYNEDEGLVIVEALCLGRPFHQGCQRFLSHAECVCISVRKKCIGTALVRPLLYLPRGCSYNNIGRGVVTARNWTRLFATRATASRNRVDWTACSCSSQR